MVANRAGTRGWSVFADGHHAETFKDKGEALRFVRRMRRSHPDTDYRLRRTVTRERSKFSTRSRKRYLARGRATGRSAERSSRAKRGPADEAKLIAKQVARWSPAGRRLRGAELDRWREQSLRSVLERHGLSVHYARVRHLVVADPVARERKSARARYKRAYGT